MFGPCLRSLRRHSPNSRSVHEPFRRCVNSTVRTMVSLSIDGFTASATDVLRFRLLYCRYYASFNCPLMVLSKSLANSLSGEASTIGFEMEFQSLLS